MLQKNKTKQEKKININNLLVGFKIRPKTININNIDVEVKQYLPMEQKQNVVKKVLELALDSPYSFVDPLQVDIIITLEMLAAYTNIDFEKISEEKDIFEIYDIVEEEGISDAVFRSIPSYEYKFIKDTVEESLDAFYKYKNSFLGILENVNQDYSNLNLDIEDLQNKLSESSEDFTFLKDVVTKMG